MALAPESARLGRALAARIGHHPALRRLAEAIALGVGFRLHIVVTETPVTVDVLARRLLISELGAANRTVRILRVEARSGVRADAMHDSEEVRKAILVPLLSEAGAGAGLPKPAAWIVDITEPWAVDAEIWRQLFRRLNERRNVLGRTLGAPLVLCITPSLEALLGIEAPDLWSVRSSVVLIDLPPSLISTPLEQERNAQGDAAALQGLQDEVMMARVRLQGASGKDDRATSQRLLIARLAELGRAEKAADALAASAESLGEAVTLLKEIVGNEPRATQWDWWLLASIRVDVGDAFMALGQGEQAREAYQVALTIRARLATAEPERADYQRDLSVSYIKMGDLFRALGQGEQAREAYQQALAIAERLAAAEPERADYQRDLSVSYNQMGDLYRALGQGEQAREAFLKALAIGERLAQAEPDRADYQRDLSVSLVRVGTADDPAAGGHLQRALAVLVAMKAAGRLETVDEPLIPEVTRLLHDRGLTSR